MPLFDLDAELAFDAGKPFHNLVVSHLAALHGFLELISRALAREMEPIHKESIVEWAKNIEDGLAKKALLVASEGKQTSLIFRQAPFSKIKGKPVDVDIDELSRILFSNFNQPLDTFTWMTAGSLLILAWDVTEGFHSHDPMWEFLRHCRNAAAHKGHFNFIHDEPRRKAEWQGLEITRDLQGTPLFSAPIADSFLGPADPLFLLHDIEQAFL